VARAPAASGALTSSVSLTIYGLPRGVQARIDHMQMIAEQILGPLGALT
jgi:hypothetical protein